MAIGDPTDAVRLLFFTITGIASAKGISIAFRKINQYLIRSHYRMCQPLLAKLYKDVNAFKISLSHRERENNKSEEFIYGEIIYSTFAELLAIVQPQPNEIFYDLGCGAGKAVFTTALLYPDLRCRGVELLPPLYELCLDLKKSLSETMAKDKYFKSRPLSVEFIQSDILKMDFSDANIVFLNATCFDPESWKKICQKLESLQVNARIIISSKSLESPSFDLIHQKSHLMSWGMNTVNIYRKIK